MRRKTAVIFLMISVALIYFVSSYAQETASEKERRTKVGGLKLPDYAYGLFGAARHINKDSTFTDYTNYHARFALWVGAKNSKGQVLVTAGSGNDVTRRPEWSPKRGSFQVESENGRQQVEKIVSLAYSDSEPFEGHHPLGLQVEQKTYALSNGEFAVLEFNISLDQKAKPLKEVYVGFWADVDAPDNEDRKSAANDKLGFASNGSAPFISDSSIKGTEIPLLGAMIPGVESPNVSWWTSETAPEGDEQRYAYLAGKAPRPSADQVDDYRFLISYGPFALRQGQTIRFPVALVQASRLADFADRLNRAKEFFTDELGGVSLNKSLASAPGLERTTAILTPQAFRLHPNFPNPFNPDTKIQFDLPEAAQVELRIYNALGQLVRTVVDRSYSAGTFTATWDGRDDAGLQLPSGMYLYKIKAGKFEAQSKLLLLK